jgi:predicted  nucleic acid-binding Zn-ribbon protein
LLNAFDYDDGGQQLLSELEKARERIVELEQRVSELEREKVQLVEELESVREKK